MLPLPERELDFGLSGSQITPVWTGAYFSAVTRTKPKANWGGMRVNMTVEIGCGELRICVKVRVTRVMMKRIPYAANM